MLLLVSPYHLFQLLPAHSRRDTILNLVTSISFGFKGNQINYQGEGYSYDCIPPIQTNENASWRKIHVFFMVARGERFKALIRNPKVRSSSTVCPPAALLYKASLLASLVPKNFVIYFINIVLKIPFWESANNFIRKYLSRLVLIQGFQNGITLK